MLFWLKKLLGIAPKTGWFTHPIMFQHEPGKQHPDSPARLAAIENELKQQNIWQNLSPKLAAEVDDKQLALVHTNNYLNRLEAQLPHEGKIRHLDDDTAICAESFIAARYAAGAVTQAVDAVMQKRNHNAFCAVRPPGHHAQSKQAGGFCLINNVAVGAMHAVSRYRLKRIAIIDCDIHRGQGTEEIFHNDPRVMLLGMSENRLYPFQTQTIENIGNIHNIDLPAETDSHTFRKLVKQYWLPRLREFHPELILISAGFDAHYGEQLGNARLHEADYAWLTHKIMQAAPQCRGKIVSVLEGGYQPDILARSVAAHVYVLAGMGKPECAKAYDRILALENRIRPRHWKKRFPR